jgi:hypothetical protein
MPLRMSPGALPADGLACVGGHSDASPAMGDAVRSSLIFMMVQITFSRASFENRRRISINARRLALNAAQSPK